MKFRNPKHLIRTSVYTYVLTRRNEKHKKLIKKLTKQAKWHEWFAWYPVYVDSGQNEPHYVFLEKVHRRRILRSDSYNWDLNLHWQYQSDAVYLTQSILENGNEPSFNVENYVTRKN